MTGMSRREVLHKVREDKIRFIRLQFIDLLGTVKCVTITQEKLEEALEKGVWFDGSSIEGFARICESDMYLMPDPTTYARIPWIEGRDTEARLICDVYTPGGRWFEGDSRHALRRALTEAEEMGFRYMVGPEVEFFLFKKVDARPVPVTHDVGGYFDNSPLDLASEVRKHVVYSLNQMGMEVETCHHEVATGQHEIDIMYDEALKTADKTVTLKEVVKAISSSYNLHATFMPKPIFRQNGSGMHIHQSLFDIKTGKNAFYDGEDPYQISKTARHFLAGQLNHIKGMTAILNPTVNSYKRLVAGYEAPVYVCWGTINRSALIRIPRFSAGREDSARVEIRNPDPSCNPYLALAVMLKAGLDGIRNEMEVPEPVEEDVYDFSEADLDQKKIDTLPGSLIDALAALRDDKVICDALGDHLLDRFHFAKLREWEDYRINVTDWEMNRYFEMT
jgi:glutamine synthetase